MIKSDGLPEPVICERCGSSFECKVDTPELCDCRTIKMDLNEMQFISERYRGCLCLACIKNLKHAYQSSMNG